MVRVKYEHSLLSHGSHRKLSLFSLAVFFVITTVASSLLPLMSHTDTASAATQAQFEICNAAAKAAGTSNPTWNTEPSFTNNKCGDNQMCTWTTPYIEGSTPTTWVTKGGWSCDETKITTGVVAPGPAPTTANLQWCRDNVGVLNQDKDWQNTKGFKDNNCASICKFATSNVQSSDTGNTTAMTYWQCGGTSITQLTAAQACDKYPHGATVVAKDYDACIAGYNNAATKDYCKTTYSGASQGVLLDACNTGSTANVTANITPAAPTTTTKDPIVCTGGALGWLLCSVAKVFKGINDAIAPQIEQQLKMDPLVTGSSISLGTRPIWGVMVGFANLVLVIAFLIVIFSQATSVGLSAYGIKKMLPRIIAAAVLINLSYFICGIAIDIANILGAAVQGIIQAGISALPKTTVAPASEFGMGLAGIATAVLGVGAVVIVGAVAYIVPLALMIILSTMVVFLGLAIRKIIIVLLIIVAPLAFAAMILPGTEGLFKKWQKSFTSMLVMYPVIMAILYGSLLVSQIILIADPETKSSTSVIGKADTSSYTAPVDASSTGIMSAIIAYAIIGLGPFAGTYMYIKNQNKIFSAAAGVVNKMGSPFKKLADGFASKSQARSMGAQLMRTRDNVADTATQRKMINRYQKGGLSSGLVTAFQGPEARRSFAAQIDKAHEDLRNAETTATRNNVGVSAAKLHADGAYWDRASNSFRQANGDVLTDEQKNDQATMKGLVYLRDNGMIATSRGGKSSTNAMRASMATLAESGALDRKRAESAIAQVDEKDRMAFMENLDNVAKSAGLTHMSYAGVRKDGSIDWAARKGGDDGQVALSLVNGGVQNQNKYVWKDAAENPGFQTKFVAAHAELNNSNHTQYWSDLAASKEDQLREVMQAHGLITVDKQTGKVTSTGATMKLKGQDGIDTTVDSAGYLAEIAKAKPKSNTP